MNDNSILGNTLSQLGGVVKKTGQQVVKMPAEVTKEAENQLTTSSDNPSEDNKPSKDDKQDISLQAEDKDTREVVKGLYAKSDNIQKADEDKKPIKGQPEFQKAIANKSVEDQKKLIQLHQQLHNQTYYDPTFNPPKKQEERPQEKIEKEEKEKKQMEALELEEKKKKELPPSVKQGTHEKVLGIAG